MKVLILIGILRENKNLSIRQLSELSGVSHTEIARIESGEVSPTLDTLLKLSVSLGVELKETFVVLKDSP